MERPSVLIINEFCPAIKKRLGANYRTLVISGCEIPDAYMDVLAGTIEKSTKELTIFKCTISAKGSTKLLAAIGKSQLQLLTISVSAAQIPTFPRSLRKLCVLFDDGVICARGVLRDIFALEHLASLEYKGPPGDFEELYPRSKLEWLEARTDDAPKMAKLLRKFLTLRKAILVDDDGIRTKWRLNRDDCPETICARLAGGRCAKRAPFSMLNADLVKALALFLFA